MPFATWWRGDPLPDLPPHAEDGAVLGVRRSRNRALIHEVTGLTRPAIEGRIKDDNAFFVALLDRRPVAYGWAALAAGRIDELTFRFAVPPGNAYLWDFETLPTWRGRGIYPRLLQGILGLLADVDRFWIGYGADNAASARGIARAGFAVVGELVVAAGRVTDFAPAAGRDEADERLVAARAVFRPLAPNPSTEVVGGPRARRRGTEP